MAPGAPVFIQPQVLPTPLVSLASGTELPAVGSTGLWFQVQFEDKQWGPRIGYIHCESVIASGAVTARTAQGAPPSEPVLLSPPAAEQQRPVELTPPIDHAKRQSITIDPPAPKLKTEHLSGYLEWRRPNYVIADGQRIRWDEHTRLKIGQYPGLQSVPLGFEFTARGHRIDDGSLIADELQVKPNGTAAFETEMRNACNQMEKAWLEAGMMFDRDSKGGVHAIGRIQSFGPRADRARRIISKLAPSYVNASNLRLYIVETHQWNAQAMANGAVFVYSGLMDDLSDDELALVLGHELVHYTHEHIRRGAKHTAMVQMTELAASAALGGMRDGAKRDTLTIASELALAAWNSGYGRDLEDQADRVGMRYAYEGGFNVTVAPRMWGRLGERLGDTDAVSNFFLGDHSRFIDRKRNAERELTLNYSVPTNTADSR